MSDESIKARVEALLSEANRGKDKGFNRSLLASLLTVFVLPFIAFFISYSGLGYGVLASLLIAVAMPVLTFVAIFALWMFDDGRRAQHFAERFREAFPKGSGDFETAMALLRTAKTESEVEKDLIEALDDVSFEPDAGMFGDLGSDLQKPTAAPQNGPDIHSEPVPKGEGSRCDYLPLDPFDDGHCAVSPACTPATRDEGQPMDGKIPPDLDLSGYEALPMADPGREQAAEQIFSEYKQVSPEEWAAHWAHTVGCSSLGDLRYRNSRLGNWIYRLHQILGNSKEVERCREKYLTAEEIEEIERTGNWL